MFLVEDDAPYRDALATILRGTPGYSCVGEFPTAEDALASLPSPPAQVALVDINLPGISGIDLVRRLRQRTPETLALMLTIFEDADRLFDSLRAGAHGYVLKSTQPAGILEAIREVQDGGAPMSRAVARKTIHHFHAQPGPSGPLSELTDRENEVLRQLASGYTAKEAAFSLGVSSETVRAHLRAIYRKLHVHSRSGALRRFLGRT